MRFELCTPEDNFINVLRAAFTRADPESVKFQLSCQYHFTLLGSAHIKDARKTLMKLTPGVEEHGGLKVSQIWLSQAASDRTNLFLTTRIIYVLNDHLGAKYLLVTNYNREC